MIKIANGIMIKKAAKWDKLWRAGKLSDDAVSRLTGFGDVSLDLVKGKGAGKNLAELRRATNYGNPYDGFSVLPKYHPTRVDPRSNKLMQLAGGFEDRRMMREAASVADTVFTRGIKRTTPSMPSFFAAPAAVFG